jgi:hypothetical protein
VPGLPIYWAGQVNREVVYLSDSTFHEAMHIDLSRPGASDILARRVATACGLNSSYGTGIHAVCSKGAGHQADGQPHPGPFFRLIAAYKTRLWSARRYGWAGHCAELSDIDPTDDARLDWSNLGAPRVVDLVALGVVAQHLYQQGRANA